MVTPSKIDKVAKIIKISRHQSSEKNKRTLRRLVCALRQKLTTYILSLTNEKKKGKNAKIKSYIFECVLRGKSRIEDNFVVQSATHKQELTTFLRLTFFIFSHVSLTAHVFYACEQQFWTFVYPSITKQKESQNFCQTT